MTYLDSFTRTVCVLDDVFSRLDAENEIVAKRQRGGPLLDGGAWTLRLQYHRDISAVTLKYSDSLGHAAFYESQNEERASLLYAGTQGCLGRQVLLFKRMDCSLAKRLLERPLHTGQVESYESGVAGDLRLNTDVFSSIMRSIDLSRKELGQSYEFIQSCMKEAEWFRTRQNFVIPSYPTVVRG